MSKPKPVYDKNIAVSIRELAAHGMNTSDIAKKLGIGEMQLRKNGIYRQDWGQGKSECIANVKKTWVKMATSGQCWAATKHYLAT
jgi:hypothetical protein